MTWHVAIVEVGLIPGLPRSLYVPDAGPSQELDLPCFVYILSDDTHVALVDSGPDAAAAGANGYRVDGPTTSALLHALRTKGMTPRDVDLIVHTHLHYDHCQNDPVFSRATVAVQGTELVHARRGERFYEGVPAMCASLGDRLRAIDGDTDLLPGLRTVANGGHTPGHQSVLVDTIWGTACLCGDIVSLATNLTEVGASCSDALATRTFLDKAFAEGWQMIPSHEPALRTHPWFISS